MTSVMTTVIFFLKIFFLSSNIKVRLVPKLHFRVMARKGIVPSSMVYGGLMVNRACSLPPDFMEVCHHQILG